MSKETEYARQRTYMRTRNLSIFQAIRALFTYLGKHQGNPELKLVPIHGVAMAADGGAADQIITTAPCKLYAVYLKKVGPVTTWIKMKGGTGDEDIMVSTADPDEELFLEWPTGHLMPQGIALREDTDAREAVRTHAEHRIDGFVVISEQKS